MSTLPELPEPAFTYERHPGGFCEPERVGAFTAEAMRAYALAAVEAERAKWQGVAEYLQAAADGSMSRNNSETLAAELLAQIREPT